MLRLCGEYKCVMTRTALDPQLSNRALEARLVHQCQERASAVRLPYTLPTLRAAAFLASFRTVTPLRDVLIQFSRRDGNRRIWACGGYGRVVMPRACWCVLWRWGFFGGRWSENICTYVLLRGRHER